MLRQALQDEESGQRRATDDPRPANRQGLPEHGSLSSPAGGREQSGTPTSARESRWDALTRSESLVSDVALDAAHGGRAASRLFTRYVWA
jgi:hypothetical protein